MIIVRIDWFAFFVVGWLINAVRPLLQTARGASAVPTVGCPFVSLVALITWRVLLLRAKHLFVAAMGDLCVVLQLDRAAQQERDGRA